MKFKSGTTQETEKKIFLSRIVFSVSMIVLLVTFILLRLVQLQIYDTDKYKLRSMNNTIRTHSLPATRGIIYDRNNQVLAENQPVFQLEMIPEQIEDVEQTLNRLIELEIIDARKLDTIKDNIRKNYQFKSIVLNSRLTERQMAVFANNRTGFKGIDIKARLSRHYPKKRLWHMPWVTLAQFRPWTTVFLIPLFILGKNRLVKHPLKEIMNACFMANLETRKF